MYKLGFKEPSDLGENIEYVFHGGMEYGIYESQDVVNGVNPSYLIEACHEDVGLVTWYRSYNDLGGLIDELMTDDES